MFKLTAKQSQIQEIEELIATSTNRLNGLEDALENSLIPANKRAQIEDELLQIKSQLDVQKDLLAEHTKKISPLMSITLFLILMLLLFGLIRMIYYV